MRLRLFQKKSGVVGEGHEGRSGARNNVRTLAYFDIALVAVEIYALGTSLVKVSVER